MNQTQLKPLQPSLGRGKIGPVTPEHVKAVNDWLAPLIERDALGCVSNLAASDIQDLLELGRANDMPANNRAQGATAANLLLIDLGQAVTQIRWGNGPWTENIHSTDMRVRLTRRGRMMLTKCCKDLWDQMLYGKPE